MNLIPRSTYGLLASVSFCAAASMAHAQCLEWKDGFGINGVDGFDPVVNALFTYDDGSGPALFIGGRFITVDGQAALAKWDGSTQSSVGGGVLGTSLKATEVFAFASFDDGSGPALYVGGQFTSADGAPASRIARWDGSSWSALGAGVNGAVRALCVFDDGSGPALYVGGQFTQAGGNAITGVAMWDGATWSSLGSGLDHLVYSLCVFDDGTGSALYVGGSFTTAGGIPSHEIARWSGTAWSSLAGGTGPGVQSGHVLAMTVCDVGQGPELIVAGAFSKIGGVDANKIARWNGTSFSPLGLGFGSGFGTVVRGVGVVDLGSGPELYAGGHFGGPFGSTGTINRIARWNGSSWSPLGTGVEYDTINDPLSPFVNAIASFDNGAGTVLCVGGGFEKVGGKGISNLAQWDGGVWGEVIHGKGVNGPISAFADFNDGDGPALYAGGAFTSAGGVSTRNIARWNGSQWSALADGLASGFEPGGVRALAVFDSGDGPRLYAGGDFSSYLRMWDGTSWQQVGGGINGAVYALKVFDDGSGPALFVGGNFEIAGGAPIRCIARWDGHNWDTVSSGTSFDVRALEVWDDGQGPALYVGGSFTVVAGENIKYIAKWNGSTFEQLGAGIDKGVYAMTVHDDGSGPALYVGGSGGFPGPNSAFMARWDGTTWTSVGGGISTANGIVAALLAYDDGDGQVLYAGGSFVNAGGVSVQSLARWDGTSWSDVGGVDGTVGVGSVGALASYDDLSGGGRDLYVGGAFLSAGGKLASNIAELLRCDEPQSFCFGDGLDAQVTTACPCANFGDSGHGCGNSVSTGGALLTSTGTIDPDTLDFTVTDVPAGVSTTYLQGNAVSLAGIVFGDGVRCVAGSLTRLGSHNDTDLDNSTSFGPSFGDPQISAVGAVQPGTTYWYQTSYRNPNASWCPPATFNITNGLTINWP